MSTADIIVISDLATVIVSFGGTLVLSGRWIGMISTKITQIEKDLAEIKGMFVLRLRE